MLPPFCWKGKNPDQEDKPMWIIPAAVSAGAVLVIVITMMLMCKRKKHLGKPREVGDGMPSEPHREKYELPEVEAGATTKSTEQLIGEKEIVYEDNRQAHKT